MQEIFNIHGPYDFDRVLERLALDPLHVVNRDMRQVKVPVRLGNEKHVYTITATGTTNEPTFELSGDISSEAVSRIHELFQWNRPLISIHEHFLTTDLAPMFQEHRGTPLVLDFDPYDCLLKCIVHQQLNLKFAHTLTHRFVTTYGEVVEGVYFYPDPQVVANLTVEDLRELQFSGRKAEYTIGIANSIVEGKLDLDRLRERTDDEIMEELVKMRGIGPWTVQNFLMFGLGRPNLFPVADIGLQNALKKLYQLDRKPTKEEMDAWKPAYEPYASYASLYLWRSIE